MAIVADWKWGGGNNYHSRKHYCCKNTRGIFLRKCAAFQSLHVSAFTKQNDVTVTQCLSIKLIYFGIDFQLWIRSCYPFKSTICKMNKTDLCMFTISAMCPGSTADFNWYFFSGYYWTAITPLDSLISYSSVFYFPGKNSEKLCKPLVSKQEVSDASTVSYEN